MIFSAYILELDISQRQSRNDIAVATSADAVATSVDAGLFDPT